MSGPIIAAVAASALIFIGGYLLGGVETAGKAAVSIGILWMLIASVWAIARKDLR